MRKAAIIWAPPPERAAAWGSAEEGARIVASFSQDFTSAARKDGANAVHLAANVRERQVGRAWIGDHHEVNSCGTERQLRAKNLANAAFGPVAVGGSADLLGGHDAEAGGPGHRRGCQKQNEVRRGNARAVLLHTQELAPLPQAGAPEKTQADRGVVHREAAALGESARPVGHLA